MKKKIYKICGVALALVLVFSLFGAFIPVNQVEADPDEVAWSGIANPGKTLRTGLNMADVDVGPIAVTPDGETLFAAVQCEAAIPGVSTTATPGTDDWALLQSTDGGHNWSATGLKKNPGPITGIAISPNFATDGTMYVAAGSVPLAPAPAVFRSDDSGATFIELKGVPPDSGDPRIPTTIINSIDMWPASPYPYVMVGTNSDVWVLQDMPFGAWMDQELDADARAAAFAPDFATSNFIWAVTAAGVVTATNSPGAWGTILGKTDPPLGTTVHASIGFADDYDSSTSPHLWVGLAGVADGVWRVRGYAGGSYSKEQLKDVDIRSIAVSGSMAAATILAGEESRAYVRKSTNGGMTWPGTAVVKQPTGAGVTYVVMAPDFATSNLAYVGTSDFIILEHEGSSTAEWSTTAPAGYSGTYCVELICSGSTLLHWSAAKVAYGETLETFVALTATKGSYTVLDVAFNVWATDNPVNYAMLWIDEDADGTVDTRLTGGFDVDGADGSVISVAGSGWIEAYKTSAATWQLRDYDAGVVTDYTGTNNNEVDSLPGYLADGGANAIVVYVGVGYTNNTDPAYVDDITIGGVTYQMESDDSSAFQVSGNAGVSWNQTGLIDTDIDAIKDIAVVNCDTVFMATATTAPSWDLWKTTDATATAPIWERILTDTTIIYGASPLTDITFVANSPEFATDSVVYATDSKTNVVKSTDGGDIFTAMGPPDENITTLCVVDAIFAFTGAVGDVYRSDDSGYSWIRTTTAPGTVTIVSIAISPDYANDSTLLVGNDAGAVYRSTNSGATFSKVGTDTGVATNTYVAFDPEYADNSLIYAGGDAVIARYDFTATALGWVDIDAAISVGITGASVFSYSVTAGSATIAVANDADGDVTIVGTTVTLPDVADAVAITAGVGGATVVVTATSGTQTCDPESGTALAAGASMTVTYLASGIVTGASEITGLLTSPDGTIYGSNLLANQGVERSLNPTSAAPAPPPTFERVTDQLAAAATLAGLWLVVDPAIDVVGSKNVLFSIDTANVKTVTYTDTLATTVVLIEPADGTVYPRETAVTMVWEELTGADTYQWQIATDSKFRLVQDEGFSRYTSDSSGELAAGRTYYWRVRVADAVGGDPLLSRWSNAPAYESSAHWTFTTFLGERPWHPFMPMSGVNPSPGATDIPVKPTFQWNGADWATTYDLELADNSAFTGATKKTLSTTAWTCDPALDYNTTYYWKVKAVSDVTESEWSDVGVFTTVAEVVPPAKAYSCPQCGLQFDTEAALKAHWDKFHAPPTPIKPITPAYIWAIIGVGALLVVAVIVLILRTRRVA